MDGGESAGGAGYRDAAGGVPAVNDWVRVTAEAERLEAEYPGWRVRPWRRPGRPPGVTAMREGSGVCSLTGPVGEVRAELAAGAGGPVAGGAPAG